MKVSRKAARSTVHSIPEIRFEDQDLSSFSGVVLLQRLFQVLGLKESLRGCFRHLGSSGSYGLHSVFLVLVLHVFLGWRRLRDLTYYHDDPLVRRALGLKRLPSVSCVSRSLRSMDERSVERVASVSEELVLQRLDQEDFRTLTVDFDGSVISTRGAKTEGTAVGFNPKKKGGRSYYPLFATVAQTGQVLRTLHRPGNVHDSRGAAEFAQNVFLSLRKRFPGTRLEARLDSAHFSEKTLIWLDGEGVEFTISVPFERLTELKEMVTKRKRWRRIDREWSYFETDWRPKSWNFPFRFIFVRHRVPERNRGPIQLDLFEPASHTYDYKVIVTNKPGRAKNVLRFHHGRGSQEGIFAELKSEGHMDYVPTRRLVGNQMWFQAGILAHNLNRELQMRIERPRRATTAKRACAYVFERLRIIRHRLIQRAGRLTRPNGVLTLTLSANEGLAREFRCYLDAVRP